MDITTLAQIVSVIGIFGSIARFISAIRFKNCFLTIIAVISIFTFSFVLYGIHEQQPYYLLTAVIILATVSVIEFIIIIALIVLFACRSNFSEPGIKASFIGMVVIFVLATSYAIFSIVVIDSSRKHLIEQNTFSSSTSPLNEVF